MPQADIRQAPSEAFIEDLRARYPVERTIDKALTRKMKQRTGPAYSPYVMADFEARLTQFLSHRVKNFTIRNLAPLPGGASKEQFAFRLDWTDDSNARRSEKLIIRRAPRESSVETWGSREFQMVAALDGRVPVPKAYWIDEEGEEMERSSLVYGFASGVQKPSKGRGNVSGIGTYFPAELRPTLAEDFIDALAALHSWVPDRSQLGAFDFPTVGTKDGVIRTINWWARAWAEDRLEDVPLMAVAEHWLRENAPVLDHISAIHGDYRAGNFLFNEDTARITAILDWELCYFGDRHADLAWAMFSSFATQGEAGETLISGLLPADEFIRRYQERSGLSVDPKRLTYFTVLELWKGVMLTAASSARVANGLKTHQNILLGWVASVSYVMLEQLRQVLAKEI